MTVTVLNVPKCADHDCLLNVDGKCNSIDSILLDKEIGGLPEPDTCSNAQYPFASHSEF